MKTTVTSVLQTILIPVLVLLALWLVAERAVDSILILPGPGMVLVRAGELLATAAFRRHLYATLGRVLAAFAVSAVLSVIIGSLQAFIPALERCLRLPMTFVKAAPVVSFILIALFWFTTGTVPVFVAVVMTLPVISVSVYKGLTSTDRKLLDMCRVYGFTRLQTLKWCYIPSALPVFSAGAVTAFAQTWKVVVAAEVISLPQKALGSAMQTAKVHLETADVFAITLILVTVSFILESVFRYAITVIPEVLKQVQHDTSAECHPEDSHCHPELDSGSRTQMLKQAQTGTRPVEVTISSFTSVRGGRTIYSGFSHRFPAGTVTAVIAPSGTGKTTLLDHIAGQVPRRVSYIFQEPRLLPALRVVQNVAAPLYRTMGKPAATERALELLSLVGLSHKAASRVTELSGGEKQRVALARAFAYPAPVLLMDEAFQSQDVHLRLQLMELFESMLWKNGTAAERTVIMATHDVKEAVTLADEILILRSDSAEKGITAPDVRLAMQQDRSVSARQRYLSGNPEKEQLILTQLFQSVSG